MALVCCVCARSDTISKMAEYTPVKPSNKEDIPSSGTAQSRLQEEHFISISSSDWVYPIRLSSLSTMDYNSRSSSTPDLRTGTCSIRTNDTFKSRKALPWQYTQSSHHVAGSACSWLCRTLLVLCSRTRRGWRSFLKMEPWRVTAIISWLEKFVNVLTITT